MSDFNVTLTDEGRASLVSNIPDLNGFKAEINRVAVYAEVNSNKPALTVEARGVRSQGGTVTINAKIPVQAVILQIKKVGLIDKQSGKVMFFLTRGQGEVLATATPVTSVSMNFPINFDATDGSKITVQVMDDNLTQVLNGHINDTAAHPWAHISHKPPFLVGERGDIRNYMRIIRLKLSDDARVHFRNNYGANTTQIIPISSICDSNPFNEFWDLQEEGRGPQSRMINSVDIVSADGLETVFRVLARDITFDNRRNDTYQLRAMASLVSFMVFCPWNPNNNSPVRWRITNSRQAVEPHYGRNFTGYTAQQSQGIRSDMSARMMLDKPDENTWYDVVPDALT